MSNKKIAFILGTRPEIIKCAHVIFGLKAKRIHVDVINLCQQSSDMTTPFFELFQIEPINLADVCRDVFLTITPLINFLKKEGYTDVVVQGDTNSALAGAIAASHSQITLHHIEAGLRSDDYRMREEYNRIMIDHISDVLYAPSSACARRLEIHIKKRGSEIYFSGNPIMDTLYFMEKFSLIKKIDTTKAILTLHRPENVDDAKKLDKMLSIVSEISQKREIEIIFFIHPRTEKMMINHQMSRTKYKGIVFMPPADYPTFLGYLKSAPFVITDSGGIQEECVYFKIPCITLRKTTERPETVKCKVNHIAGDEMEKIDLEKINIFINNFSWKKVQNPFLPPKGTPTDKIIERLMK